MAAEDYMISSNHTLAEFLTKNNDSKKITKKQTSQRQLLSVLL